MKKLFFFLLKTNYFWSFHAFLKKVILKGKLSAILDEIFVEFFTFYLNFLYTKSNETTILIIIFWNFSVF